MRKDIFYKDDNGCREASHQKMQNGFTMPTNYVAENNLWLPKERLYKGTSLKKLIQISLTVPRYKKQKHVKVQI